MKYISSFFNSIFALILLQLSSSTMAIGLSDVKIPASLKPAYKLRYSDPQSCVQKTNQYIIQQKLFKLNNEHNSKKPPVFAFPQQLQALCYVQLENYTKAFELLKPTIKEPNLSKEEIRKLILIALEIPEEERPTLRNQQLLKTLSIIANKIEKNPAIRSPNLSVILQLAISKLSLQTNHYRAAYQALEKTKKHINGTKGQKLHAWLAYYYGLYYDQINQQQLASSSFLLANNLANKYMFINLAGEVKNSIANMYQKKHRFPIALNFAKQRVELYLTTKNNIKQAQSLIQFAVLKRQNNENNQALIYLFNALELIPKKQYVSLLAHAYLETGKTYLASGNKKNNKKNLELAQKYLQNARFHFTQLNKTRAQTESLLLLAKLNIRKKEPALAILQLEKVLQLSAHKYLTLRVQAFEMLALSYENTGNHQQAILHFKNFHALQNRIKEHLFKLQQLQISEQLQLFKQTQQQQELKSQNTQLQKKTNHFKTLSYSTLTLLILVTLMFFYTLTRNKNLIESDNKSQQRLAFHPRTKLPLQYADNNNFKAICHSSPLYYALVNIPFLSRLNELLGISKAEKIEEDLGKSLNRYFNQHIDIFQVRDNQILFISKQKEHRDAGDFAKKLQLFFSSFSERNQLEKNISCGIVAFPFLKNASRAIAPKRILNLSSLALFAATQIRQATQQSSWVELYAIDNLQPAFFDGDIWALGQAAIDKGLIKIKSNHSEHVFYWPELDK